MDLCSEAGEMNRMKFCFGFWGFVVGWLVLFLFWSGLFYLSQVLSNCHNLLLLFVSLLLCHLIHSLSNLSMEDKISLLRSKVGAKQTV